MSARAWEPIAQAAQWCLDDIDDIVPVINQVMREAVPSYASVPEQQLSDAVKSNVSNLLTGLRDKRVMTPAELEAFRLTVEQRARNGVAIDDYLLAITQAEEEIWQQVVKRGVGFSDALLAEAHVLRLQSMNVISRVTAYAHRLIELAAVRADHERRGEAVRALLRGGLAGPELDEQFARLGLTQRDGWFVVHARSRKDTDLIKLLQVENSAFILWGDDAVGLTPRRPSPVAEVTIAVAGPARASDLAESHRQCGVLLATAWALGRQGVEDLRSLGIAAAVQASPEVGSALRERYIGPLHDSGSLGSELLDTVRAFLQAGGRRDLAADRLHLHHNTVGYRLSRFTELTGADLSDLDAIAELHWLFLDLDLRP